jgi:hypothetical protein
VGDDDGHLSAHAVAVTLGAVFVAGLALAAEPLSCFWLPLRD